ncbi:MAG: membrane protein insertion efficiency factor YidD [Emcibacter sp.]|nr:membrane protein insertion efficiency factor YidD [Emcibacter sp.]
MILLNWLLKGVITVYRYTLSPLLGKNCRYLPTCSEYAEEAIDRFGAFKGGLLALRRIGRCHPWGGHGYDPVPEKEEETDEASDGNGPQK